MATAAPRPTKKITSKKPTNPNRALLDVKGKNVAVFRGLDDLSTWDDEELSRGYRKDKRGRFSGRPPTAIPAILHRELRRRQFKAANDALALGIPAMTKALMAIIESPTSDDKAKVAAIKLGLERVLGKVPEKVELEVRVAPWEDALKGGIVPGDDDELFEDDDVIEVDGRETA